MKIDFDMIERLVAAGASGAVILQLWRDHEVRKEPKRTKERKRQQAKRANKQQQAPTSSNIEQQAPTHLDLERAYFARANEVCGGRAGSIAASLLKAKGQDVKAADAVLDAAMKTRDPRGYVAAACKENGNGTSRQVYRQNSLAAAADDLIERARDLERARGVDGQAQAIGGVGEGKVVDGTVV